MAQSVAIPCVYIQRWWYNFFTDESKKKDRYEDAKKFVRYSDGAKMYSMGMTKFQEGAKDAKACYKIGQLAKIYSIRE